MQRRELYAQVDVQRAPRQAQGIGEHVAGANAHDVCRGVERVRLVNRAGQGGLTEEVAGPHRPLGGWSPLSAHAWHEDVAGAEGSGVGLNVDQQLRLAAVALVLAGAQDAVVDRDRELGRGRRRLAPALPRQSSLYRPAGLTVGGALPAQAKRQLVRCIERHAVHEDAKLADLLDEDVDGYAVGQRELAAPGHAEPQPDQRTQRDPRRGRRRRAHVQVDGLLGEATLGQREGRGHPTAQSSQDLDAETEAQELPRLAGERHRQDQFVGQALVPIEVRIGRIDGLDSCQVDERVEEGRAERQPVLEDAADGGRGPDGDAQIHAWVVPPHLVGT